MPNRHIGVINGRNEYCYGHMTIGIFLIHEKKWNAYLSLRATTS